MKRLRIFILMTLILAFAATSLLACSSKMASDSANLPSPTGSYIATGDVYNEITENPFVDPSEIPNSTFSLAVHTAGYSNLRSYINRGDPINPNMVKIEEVVNYFKYNYPDPAEGNPVSLSAKLCACPWNESAKLLTIGIKAKAIENENIANNLVFLLDVSGSMNSASKIGLLKSSMLKLLDSLDQNDRVSIVTYSGSSQVLLEGENGSQKEKITKIINKLQSGGSTNGEGGIRAAYSLATDYFIEGGNNRVILATDGDFNVGISDKDELKTLITEQRASGVYLTCLGFGSGNLQDATMEALANYGNGNYAFIDSEAEAYKVLVTDVAGTLHTVARDAKIKVEFNPAKVARYRLLGYENSLLSMEEYLDDDTDAGEIGSGFTVTAVYEVVVSDNAYAESSMEDNLLNVELRYKSPDTADTTEHSINIYATSADILSQPTADQEFISALIETCLILRRSQYKGSAFIYNVQSRLEDSFLIQNDPYRAEFKALVQKLIDNYDYNSVTVVVTPNN